MANSLDLKTLQDAVAGTAAAFRCRTKLQPVGGEGDKVFPPTYAGGQYATENRRIQYQDENGQAVEQVVPCVLLDSVQSQANRMELSLLDAWERGEASLPVIAVDFSQSDRVTDSELAEVGRNWRITSLEAPHRIADAILRDSVLADGDESGTPFSKSQYAGYWGAARLHNATPLFKLCPSALVFGTWGSPEKPGGLGAKFQRAIVSEIVGVNAEIGSAVSSRVDPLGIRKEARPIYQNGKDDNGEIGWTLDEKKAAKSGKSAVELGKGSERGRPSQVNHGNVVPSVNETTGGATISYALQTTTLSLAALRRLRFPLDGNGRSDRTVDYAARTALAAMGLASAALAREWGGDLRSRCQLHPVEPIEWELLDKPGADGTTFELSADQALSLFNDAVSAATKAGLPWLSDGLSLKPSDELVELVRKSQELETGLGEEEEG
jgi:CRISPR-associated protein Csb1